MSSRDPEELRDELEDVDFTGGSELLPELRSEARETVDAQKETLADIDTKASQILRLNILLIGVIVSVLSFTAQNGGGSNSGVPSAGPFINLYMKLGVASLVLSTALAAMTYTASELDVGVSSDNLASLLGTNFSLDEAEELLVKNYIIRINFNRSTNIRNIPLITSTVVFVVTAVVLFALGIYEAMVGAIPWWLSLLVVILLVCVIGISGLVTQTIRAIRDIQEWH